MKTMNRIFSYLWILLLLIPAWSNAADARSQQPVIEDQFSPQEMESFHSGPDFKVISGAIRLDPAFGFADGTYKLVNAQIVAVAPMRYQLILDFARRKGVFSYRHQEKLALLYDGTRLWFKRRGEVYRYRRPMDPGWQHKDKYQQQKRGQNHLAVELAGLELQLNFY